MPQERSIKRAPSPHPAGFFNAGRRASGTFGENIESMKMYHIYVKSKDLEKATHVIKKK